MIFLYMVIVFFVGMMLLEKRRNYSRYIVHAINFKHKLLFMSLEDPFWMDFYNKMPSDKKIARVLSSRGLHTLFTDEEYKKYYMYDMKHGVKK